MPKSSSNQQHTARSASRSPAAAPAALTALEREVITTDLEKSTLRKIAERFVVGLKERFDPLSTRDDAHLMTNIADKIVAITQEVDEGGNPVQAHTDRRARNLFYAPSMFADGDWHKLSTDERLKIISTGLKITGKLIEQRYERDNLTGYLLRQDSKTRTSQQTPAVAASTADTSAAKFEQSQPPAPSPRATPQPQFNISFLLSKIAAVLWRDDFHKKLTKELHYETLLDLINLSVSDLNKLLKDVGSDRLGFDRALAKVDYLNPGANNAPALRLLFSNVEQLGLCSKTVIALRDKEVRPSEWSNTKSTFIEERRALIRLPIDNVWRLLRHYDPKQPILTGEELSRVKAKLADVGILRQSTR